MFQQALTQNPDPTHPGQGAGDYAAEWERAYHTWLAGLAPNTRRAYRRAWDDLLAHTGKHPARIRAADIQDWADDLAAHPLDPTVLKGLRRRGSRNGDGAGLSPATIHQWLSAISSFYRHASARHLVRAPGGEERPLHPYNPAANVTRPDVPAYAGADYLDARQLARLLHAIPTHTVAGLRDYALILGYILTGRRNTEWRTLRWGDLRARGPRVYYTWRGKNTGHARNELPPPLWDAIRDYLDAAGRLPDIQPDDYLFTPLNDNATRLPNIDPAGWDADRPLTPGTVNQLLKKHARAAGLDPARIHVHTLRHSAAMLEDQLGANLTHITQFLGHTDPKTTMRYLHHLRGRPDTTWQDKADLLDLPAQPRRP